MGKIYKVRSGKKGKRTLKEALAATNGNILELPENAVSLQVHSGIEIQVGGGKRDEK